MKRFMFFVSAIAAMSTFSLSVYADDDPKHPGYDFEPKVLYRSPDLAKALKKAPAKPKFDPKYPAAYFESSVLFPKNDKAKN